jgi:NitT/TauT family transport system substrate-binding protein
LLVLLLLAIQIVEAQEKFIFTPQWTPQAQFAGYYVAQDMGFYREAGLDVEIVHPSATQPALNRVFKNESQATTLQLCQAMEVIASGVPMVNILQTSMNNALVIVSRRGVSPLTQKGARVGCWAAGFGQLAFYLDDKEHLEYEWVPAASTVNLFVKGLLDACIAMSYNEYYQLVQSGMEFSEESVYRFCDHDYNIQEDGIYMRRDYYEAHKEQAQKFAEASRRGWEWAAEHPDETLDIVMKYVHDLHVITNRPMQRLMLEEILRLQLDRESGEREFRLRPDMVQLANNLLLESGILLSPVPYEQLIAR